MAGVKGKSGPPGNTNAQTHGFYASTLSDTELKLYEHAKVATLGDELAVMRVKLHGLLGWMSEPDNEVPEGTLFQMDRMVARVGDLEVKRSIIERNAKEAGMGEDDDPTGMVRTIEKLDAHKRTFKTNGNGKARNGSG